MPQEFPPQESQSPDTITQRLVHRKLEELNQVGIARVMDRLIDVNFKAGIKERQNQYKSIK